RLPSTASADPYFFTRKASVPSGWAPFVLYQRATVGRLISILRKTRTLGGGLRREDEMALLFGTDGVGGLANADLTPELALSVAASAARVLAAHDRSHRQVAVVGRDPR